MENQEKCGEPGFFLLDFSKGQSVSNHQTVSITPHVSLFSASWLEPRRLLDHLLCAKRTSRLPTSYLCAGITKAFV